MLGALATAVAERVQDAGERACGLRGAAPAALVALHEYAGGRPVDTLHRLLRVTPSGAVRVVDRLVDAGLAVRAPGPDGRTLSIELTPAGHAAAGRVRHARSAALAAVTAPLDGAGREALAAVAGALLAGLTEGPDDAWRICRLCDPHACGHHDGRCPVTAAAHAGGR